MKARILSTGDELVRGRTRDLNHATLASALAQEGITVLGGSLVGDDEDALVAALEWAADTADIVLMSGGLGPTADDCTRSAAARAAGVGLEQHESLVDALRARWDKRGLTMPESNLSQAFVPEGSEILPNRFGTAVGFRVRIRGAEVFALPGPPREMSGVLEEEVLPRIRELIGGGGRVVRTRVLETFGEPESRVGERLGDLMDRGRSPRIGTSAVVGTIRVILHDEGERAEVAESLERTEAEVRRRLGPIVFGVDGATLSQVVGEKLIAGGTTVSVAESCSGGLIAGALTDVPGISAVFPGAVVTYSDEHKTRLLGVPEDMLESAGAVSREVAEAMAIGVRERFGTDLGLAVTGIAGPGGGTDEKPVGLVHIALDVRGTMIHKRLHFPGDRDWVRTLTVKTALDLVRRTLYRDR